MNDFRLKNGPLALTCGDPAGIGPDIAIKAWINREESEIPPFLYLGHPELIEQRAQTLAESISIAVVDHPAAALVQFADHFPCIADSPAVRGFPGKPSPSDNSAIVRSIEHAVELAYHSQVSAIVTCPIRKETLADPDHSHPGHTEFLGELAAYHWGGRHRPVMMLVSENLRTIPVTVHIPLRDVPRTLTRQLLIDVAEIAARDLQHRFGINSPRLAFAGLNPHAGESGLLGDEEIKLIQPALDYLRDRGISCVGPASADTLFHPEARATYDVALCMYHDQALIPIKTIDFRDAVNVTLGLPFVRTSPDHGTALEIAGTGKSDPASLIAALRMAWRICGAGLSAEQSANA